MSMSLEQMRDVLREHVALIEKDRLKYAECAYQVSANALDDLADAIDEHLAKQRESEPSGYLCDGVFYLEADSVPYVRHHGTPLYLAPPAVKVDEANAESIVKGIDSLSESDQRLIADHLDELLS